MYVLKKIVAKIGKTTRKFSFFCLKLLPFKFIKKIDCDLIVSCFLTSWRHYIKLISFTSKILESFVSSMVGNIRGSLYTYKLVSTVTESVEAPLGSQTRWLRWGLKHTLTLFNLVSLEKSSRHFPLLGKQLKIAIKSLIRTTKQIKNLS